MNARRQSARPPPGSSEQPCGPARRRRPPISDTQIEEHRLAALEKIRTLRREIRTAQSLIEPPHHARDTETDQQLRANLEAILRPHRPAEPKYSIGTPLRTESLSVTQQVLELRATMLAALEQKIRTNAEQLDGATQHYQSRGGLVLAGAIYIAAGTAAGWILNQTYALIGAGIGAIAFFVMNWRGILKSDSDRTSATAEIGVIEDNWTKLEREYRCALATCSEGLAGFLNEMRAKDLAKQKVRGPEPEGSEPKVLTERVGTGGGISPASRLSDTPWGYSDLDETHIVAGSYSGLPVVVSKDAMEQRGRIMEGELIDFRGYTYSGTSSMRIFQYEDVLEMIASPGMHVDISLLLSSSDHPYYEVGIAIDTKILRDKGLAYYGWQGFWTDLDALKEEIRSSGQDPDRLLNEPTTRIYITLDHVSLDKRNQVLIPLIREIAAYLKEGKPFQELETFVETRFNWLNDNTGTVNCPV